MGKRVSFADQVYDRFCQDHVLKAGKGGGAQVQKKLFTEQRASLYEIAGLGRLCLLRETGLFGPRREQVWFIPTAKDAPVMHITTRNGSARSTLDIQLPQTMLSPIRYQQFSRALESFDRLQDAEAQSSLKGVELLPGSASKTGSNEELSAMLEEYLNAYLRVLDMAQLCDRVRKEEKNGELAELYLKHMENREIAAALAQGGDPEAFVRKQVFGLD